MNLDSFLNYWRELTDWLDGVTIDQWTLFVLCVLVAMVHHYAMDVGNKLLRALWRIEVLQEKLLTEQQRSNERLDASSRRPPEPPDES